MSDDERPTVQPSSSEPPWVPLPEPAAGALEPPSAVLEPTPPPGEPASTLAETAPIPAEPVTLAAAVATPPPPDIPLVSTGRLLAASFDLLNRSGVDMRRASFYIGLIVLGTVGPLALASWGVLVIDMESGFERIDTGLGANGDALFAGLGLLAFIGLVVGAVESRTLAMTVLGGRMIDRPVSTRRALARSRRMFWSAILASILAAIPVFFAQGIVANAVGPMFGQAADAASVITSTLVTALIGGPFAYVLAGVVLGDVDPFEALRRSFRVFRARKLAAAVVVVFEAITALLVLFGIEAGLDLVLRLFDGLGLGPDAGPLGLAATTVGVVAVTFAFGTLLFTVMAITVAPQVVMFLSLTHATNGLDRVREGGLDDPDVRRPGRPRFRWLTRSMLVGFVLGAIGLALALSSVAG